MFILIFMNKLSLRFHKENLCKASDILSGMLSESLSFWSDVCVKEIVLGFLLDIILGRLSSAFPSIAFSCDSFLNPF